MGKRVGSLVLTFHKALPGPSTPPGFGLREAIKTRQSRAYETATFADLIGRSMGGVSLLLYNVFLKDKEPMHLVLLSLEFL